MRWFSLYCPPNSVVLSQDEKGRTPVKIYPGMKWTNIRKYYTPYAQKVKGLFDIFAVKNIHTGERYWKFYDWKNSFIVIDFFEWILNDLYPDKDVYIIFDNWSCHKSGTFMAWADLQPRLHLVYLPTCTSWLNQIERDFSQIQRFVLNNSDFQNPKECMGMISQFFIKELCSNGGCT